MNTLIQAALAQVLEKNFSIELDGVPMMTSFNIDGTGHARPESDPLDMPLDGPFVGLRWSLSTHQWGEGETGLLGQSEPVITIEATTVQNLKLFNWPIHLPMQGDRIASLRAQASSK